jgi:Zn-finger nucleic acid-binding protein
MFEGARYCPHCGARRSRLEADPATPLVCPRCRDAMRRVSIGEVPLAECGHCDGVWLDAADFEALCASRDAQSAILHRTPPKSAVDSRRVRYRKCPVCRTLMNRVNFGKASGIILDVCKGHGTYLDAGELGRVVEFIRRGGLELARAREREALVEEQQRLRELEARAGGHLSCEIKSGVTDSGLAEFLSVLMNR